MVFQHALQVSRPTPKGEVEGSWGVSRPTHKGVLAPGGACSSRGLLQQGSAPGGVWRPPPTATAAGGTHPTGMHSCLLT